MPSVPNKDLDALRTTLGDLPPTGDKGFEGLIQGVLEDIVGIPFRLAASGSQYGLDGSATGDIESIGFECKLYKDEVPKNALLSKLAEISIQPEIELWVLCATCSVSSQREKLMRKVAEEAGFETLVLDWSAVSMPLLATALALAPIAVKNFLKRAKLTAAKGKAVEKVLEDIKSDSRFSIAVKHLNEMLAPASIGVAAAHRANERWLKDTFGSYKAARLNFGQPLCPGDPDRGNVAVRLSIVQKIDDFFTKKNQKPLLFVLGEEGNGKSWAVAQAWLRSDPKPFMLVLSAEQFKSKAVPDLHALLAEAIAAQTGSRGRKYTQRWLSKLEHDRATGLQPIVLVDGVNQRPNADWPRMLEALESVVTSLGGRIIVTSRTAYFKSRVSNRLTLDFKQIPVPEWTAPERDEILKTRSLSPSDLTEDAAKSLRNPRLLGLALELMNNAQIVGLKALTVGRLLFEHIRSSDREGNEPQPVLQYVAKLRKHADDVIKRCRKLQVDDLLVFDGELKAAADGRFFNQMEGDLYSIDSDGLQLALALAVINALQSSIRNRKDTKVTIEALLEPISALDSAANIVMAALSVSRFLPPNASEVTQALLESFSTLQNPDAEHYRAFETFVPENLDAFMGAAQSIWLSPAEHSNADWIASALVRASRDPRVWDQMAPHVSRWLQFVCFAPEIGVFSHKREEEFERQLEKRTIRLNEKLAALTPEERALLDSLPQVESDPAELGHLAASLLQGKSLKSFAPAITAWSLATALNASHRAAHEDFWWAFRSNHVDWQDTRVALDAAKESLGSNRSVVGDWAYVNALRLTGEPADGLEADLLATELTKDREPFAGWNSLRNQCEVDPCDPNESEPDNVKATAKIYSVLEVSKLRRTMGVTSEDNDFQSQRAAVARFYPAVAVRKHREFADDVLTRSGFPLRQGLLALYAHGALLNREFANKLLSASRNAADTDLSESDQWLIDQFRLLVGLPWLTPNEQLESLLNMPVDERVLLETVERMSPVNAAEFEDRLLQAISNDNNYEQDNLLAYAFHTEVPLTTEASEAVENLVKSASARTRGHAMSILADRGTASQLLKFANSDWTADGADEDTFEPWYGSMALVRAFKLGQCSIEDIFTRISPRVYGLAVAELPALAAGIKIAMSGIFDRIVETELALPEVDIELQFEDSSPLSPILVRIADKPVDDADPMEWLDLSDDTKKHEERQKHRFKVFDAFRDLLTKVGLRQILDSISADSFRKVIGGDEATADRWHAQFMNAKLADKPALYNFALMLAQALTGNRPDKAIELQKAYADIRPMLVMSYGLARIELERLTAWYGNNNDSAFNVLCFKRISDAPNNYEIAREVLAAMVAGKAELLQTYSQQQLSKAEPYAIALALMVTGYGPSSAVSDAILSDASYTASFLGNARKTAQQAYERNKWALHWYEKMCTTNSNREFWRCSVLFEKVVDERFVIWSADFAWTGAPINAFGETIRKDLGNRFKKIATERQKKLFGDNKPRVALLRL